jgi:hypothetical protein
VGIAVGCALRCGLDDGRDGLCAVRLISRGHAIGITFWVCAQEFGNATWVEAIELVYRLLNPLGFVAFKMVKFQQRYQTRQGHFAYPLRTGGELKASRSTVLRIFIRGMKGGRFSV